MKMPAIPCQVRKQRRILLFSIWVALLASCQTSAPYQPQPRKDLGRYMSQRISLLIILSDSQAQRLIQTSGAHRVKNMTLSTATPISSQGHFLTNAHSLQDLKSGYSCVAFYSSGAHKKLGKVQLIWKDERADLALVKASFATPYHYQWTPRDRWLPTDLTVVHGGMTTGPEGQIGHLHHSVMGFGRSKPVLHSLRLKPGDSGGPLLTLSGELIGINRAVGYTGVMTTTFFTESQSIRPDPAKIQRLVDQSQAASTSP